MATDWTQDDAQAPSVWLRGLGARLAARRRDWRYRLLRSSVEGLPPRPNGSRKPTPLRALIAAVAVAGAVAGSCRSLPSTPPTAVVVEGGRGRAPSLAALVPEPAVRVGILTDASRLSFGADSGVVAWGGQPDAWSVPAVGARVTVVPVVAGTAPRYHVQAASLMDEQAAREFAARVREASGLEPQITWSDATRTHRIRVGEFITRAEAQRLTARLSEAGIGGSQILELAPREPGGRLRIEETGREFASVLVVPSEPLDPVYADATPYRGVMEVRVNDSGTLTVINVVGLESYLRGVVPNELSPEAFPSLEALKAQAVAARTYTLRNKGGYESRGYDLCATAACQVYRGVSSEHEMSDRAVAETAGVVALYRGQPIRAFYTSTCGGHTEDGENIFSGEGAEYLRGVSCVAERRSWATLGSTAVPRELGEVPGLNRDAALLEALGVLDPGSVDAGGFAGPASDAEIGTWTARLREVLHRDGCQSRVEPPLNRRASFLAHLVGTLCWTERAERMLAPGDSGYLLQASDAADLGAAEQQAMALLVQEGVLAPADDGRLHPASVVSRGEAVRVLAEVARIGGPPALLTARFRGVTGFELVVGEADPETAQPGELGESKAYPLDPAVRLFRSLGETSSAVAQVTLSAGEELEFVLREGRVAYLEAEQSRLGAAADRMSRYYRWEARRTPAQLARYLARYADVGVVQDVVPRRIGTSGRVVELDVVGTRGTHTLRGLEVRRGLGLRENLFVVERERAADGAVARFVFTGKGWGHGVGLCQVGSFGMALAGASYDEILGHYYTGINLSGRASSAD